ncbi:hypothetical protein HLH34_17830 [Gluconacetobacter azotocaptans]|uniref:Uncharacterized protein n=1 Tax=Gluconacetobacter azotocaptans TaxID=142834 RepID=A0A7W4JVQ5_9PROT|nr:hypothetical protein [Gluconacetobacter azotocaptans]MBB2191796.1 hypothetical protein [Gluconacetobacter azotocaptans]GBQ26905.1 hypothetical protein AA13594_0406 [Gluconacetobacter azotocaptans DSM 13594]
MEYPKSYKIFIDKRWSLEDLYKFPRAYEQVYFAFEAVLPSPDEVTDERIERAFRAFPWQGGYSAVSFYNQLKYATPPKRRPLIQKMQYASPGYIELLLNLPLAVQIAGVVGSVAASIGACNKTYNAIHTDLQKRKLLRMDVEKKKIALTKEQLELVTFANEEIAKILDLPSTKAILERTNDPLISLKILLSIYRRIRTLSEYKINGKAELPEIIEFDE